MLISLNTGTITSDDQLLCIKWYCIWKISVVKKTPVKSTHLYTHSSWVSRKVDTKWNVIQSPGGVLSGNSGRQKQTQEWTSARLKGPDSLMVFRGLKNHKQEKIRSSPHNHDTKSTLHKTFYQVYIKFNCLVLTHTLYIFINFDPLPSVIKHMSSLM